MCSVGFIELAREQFLAEYEAVGIKMSTFKSSQKWVEWFPDRVQINKFILKKMLNNRFSFGVKSVNVSKSAHVPECSYT